MLIQCPECSARYRTKVLPKGLSRVQVKCPKCSHQFTVVADDDSPESAEKKTILMVDDARFFRELMLDLLADSGANLKTADNAEEALQVLQQEVIDLLIVDINLPDKNGLDLIRELRAEQRFADLSILCISGVYRKDDDALTAIRAGADDFISKSFKPHELNERIDKLLNR